ncbi:RNA polymerase sigma factor [Nonomuraea sp. NPDC050536]|uniref:RNA polymerase sigma factor n=1 Tax=Nonomuraea sp. NPDC050536 TaxID=3364366 RepID=UPI0037C5DC57
MRDPAVLLDAAADGDHAAWVELTNRFGPRLWAAVRACGLGEADAADAVQGAWLRLLESLHTIKDPAGVGAWLTTTARREALLILRKEVPGLPSYLPVSEPDPAAEVLDADIGQRLWQAVSDLHEPCRSMLRLVAVGERQLATRLGLPPGSVGPTRARCLERLRTLISPQETVQ